MHAVVVEQGQVRAAIAGGDLVGQQLFRARRGLVDEITEVGVLAKLTGQGEKARGVLAQLVVGLPHHRLEIPHQPVRAADIAERAFVRADIRDIDQRLHCRPIGAVDVEIAGPVLRQALGVDLAILEPGLPFGVHLGDQAQQAQLPAGIDAEGGQHPAVDQGLLHGEIERCVLGRIQRLLAGGELELLEGVEPPHDLVGDRRCVVADAPPVVLGHGVQQVAVLLQGSQDRPARSADRCFEVAAGKALQLQIPLLHLRQEGLEALAPGLRRDPRERRGQMRQLVVVRHW